MIIKCKMCGGDLHPAENATTCECEFCGTVQTIPRLDSTRRANLYDRANHFRRNNEYDKAMGIFEQILQEDRTDAEAYWSVVLCRYGIEYVEDPATKKRIPTVNRTQFTSVLADEDYKSALEYADAEQKSIYEREAAAIDGIQKGILDISRKEAPFDVFICYKETDAEGKRTPDSVLANDMYHSLTKEGFKVFFSRITLEDKLGQQYEPYIFAALNSAKVMVALGTKPEYFSAAWVKNEWSRYLALIRAGQEKTLVPAYKDMDPYDLPEEFSHLQAQDMSKLGFMQDLIHGIKKLCRKEEKAEPENAARQAAAAEAAPLLKRAYIFLEDGDWGQASAYFDRVLDKDPENADAYVGNVLVTNQLHREEELSSCRAPFEESPNWRKAVRFAGEKRRTELEKLVTDAKAARERARQDAVYQGAVSRFNNQAYEAALAEFRSISKYKDAEEWIRICEDRIREIQARQERERKSEEYGKAEQAAARNTWESLTEAAEGFGKLGSFGDAREKAEACREKARAIQAKAVRAKEQELKDEKSSDGLRQILTDLNKPVFRESEDGERLRAEAKKKLAQAEAAEEEEKRQRELLQKRRQEAEKKKKRNIRIIFAAALIVIAAGLFTYLNVIKPKQTYQKGMELLQAGSYDEAAEIFTGLKDYGDSEKRLRQIEADRLFRDGKREEAYHLYKELEEEYRTHEEDYYRAELRKAEEQLAAGEFDAALKTASAVSYVNGAKDLISEIQYRKAAAKAAAGEYDEASRIYDGLGDYQDSRNLAAQARADGLFAQGRFADAAALYAQMEEKYRTHESEYRSMYSAAEEQLAAGEYDSAYAGFTALGIYGDAAARAGETLNAKAEALYAAGDYAGAAAVFESIQDTNRAKQARADALYAAGDYAGAYEIYAALDESYRTHAADYEAMYAAAGEKLQAGEYDAAYEGYAALGNYGDAAKKARGAKYSKAAALRESGEYDDAAAIYREYGDTESANAALYEKGEAKRKNNEYDEAASVFTGLKDYSDSEKKLRQTQADALYASGDYAGAYEIYAALDESYRTHAVDYEAMYAEALALQSEGKYDEAAGAFSALGNYRDSAAQIQESRYLKAVSLAGAGQYDEAIALFDSLGGYKDSKDLSAKAARCLEEKADALSAEGKYDEAAAVYREAGNTEKANLSTYRYAGQLAEQGEYRLAADQYNAIPDYEDSREQHYQTGLKAKAAGKPADALSILSEDPEYRDAKEAIYQIGLSASAEKLYEISVPAFTRVGAYKDAAMKLTMDTYAWGGQLFENGEYDRSAEVFASMGDFSDAPARAMEAAYAAAEEKLEAGEYADAKARFTVLGDYGDSGDKAKECDYRPAMALFEAGKYEEAKAIFEKLGNYRDSAEMVRECGYIPAKALFDAGDWLNAINAFKAAGLQGYKDTDTMMNECRLQIATDQMSAGQYESALTWLNNAGDYRNCRELAAECERQIALAGARALEEAGDYEGAYAEYEKAGAAEKMRETAYQAGLTRLAGSEYEEAIRWFEKAGDYSNAREQILSIGEYYYMTQQYEEAEAVYVKVRDIGVAAQRLYELGQYYELVGDPERAARAYREAGDYEDAPEKAEALQKEADYQTAESLFASRDYKGAKALYQKIPGYKDADSRIVECDNALAAAAAARKAKYAVGKYVTFGTYPQTRAGNDSTPIEWIVLARDGQKALLLSRYGLDSKPYNTEDTSVTWETCTLRNWLNGEFINKAFTAGEQAGIMETEVDNSGSQGYSGWNTSGGNNTRDRIFLLSYAEANKYFGVKWNDSKNTKSRVSPTTYALQQGAKTYSAKTADGETAGWWWLRSPGGDRRSAARVLADGSLYVYSVIDTSGCIRPALWINLESGIF